LTDTFDLAVVGGGLAGAATAYFACRRGARVVLLERGDLNLGASGSNAGSVHAQIPFDPFRRLGEAWAADYARAIPLFLASIRRWHELESELGASLGLSANGGLMVAGSDADMAALERKAAIERRAGLPVELWSAADLRARAPQLCADLVGGAFCPVEGKADPLRAVPVFAARAVEAGLDLRRNAGVESIERVSAGFALHTRAGPVRARAVVNAAGADAARVAAMAGVRVALEGHPIQVAVTERRPPVLPWLVYFTGAKLTLKQTADGGLLIGGGWPARLRGGPVVEPRSLIRNLSVARRVMPGLADVTVVRAWAAVVNGTADWHPILGEAPAVPGFFLNLFPWMGFTAAPAVSEAVADLALGLVPRLDISEFCLREPRRAARAAR